MDKKILVTKSSMPPLEEYVEEIKEMWDTHWLTNMGVKHQALQEKLETIMDMPYVELFTNGHMAIELSIQALNLNGEIITTPYTFASTTHAIVRNGCTPVFCDINEDDFTINADKIEELITDKTVAILPVHVYGNICDVEKIKKIANKYNLKVIYDAAHCFYETYKGKSVGQFGDVSCFSFHATKVFNTIEGGAASYRDEEFGRELYRLKNFGIKNETTVDGVGSNAKMNEFCAAMGLCNIRHIDEEIAKRKKIFEYYQEKLSDIKGIRINNLDFDTMYNYSYFPIIFDDDFGHNREEVYEALLAKGICSRKYFYPITSTFECYEGHFSYAATPIAFDISKKVLTLPIYAGLDLTIVDLVCDTIQEMSCE